MVADSMAEQRMVSDHFNKPYRKLKCEEGLSKSKAVSSPRQTATERSNTPAKICCREGLLYPSGRMGYIHLSRCLLQLLAEAWGFSGVQFCLANSNLGTQKGNLEVFVEAEGNVHMQSLEMQSWVILQDMLTSPSL
ncbi:Chaperone DnaJ-domain-containing protein putative isoform 3 [Tripterygium wilfordii]|uniref:Chaperone DnaJ-domain-containing protein putative isoform 3 n=1 Tax=Tripterygium wilfordii TaxID=458696 RepID=A0A7J7E2E7_TRIWF|nr:Chaperone DnaJ-domain-containing protein putative isoform 3 [Tripterygium wilfordii]